MTEFELRIEKVLRAAHAKDDLNRDELYKIVRKIVSDDSGMSISDLLDAWSRVRVDDFLERMYHASAFRDSVD